MSDASNQRLKRVLVQRLESLGRAGLEVLKRPPEAAAEVTVPTVATSADPPARLARPLAGSAAAKTGIDDQIIHQDDTADMAKTLRKKRELLAEVKQQVAGCTLCAELAEHRTQTVFGVGNPQARLCFFGEAPGADEDKQGEPFVGRAGKLLTDIIQKGMGLERSDVFILNVLKCRPPQNRNPKDDEVANCRPFFERQLEIIAPEFICCLGLFAAQTLLDTKQSVGRLRGTLHEYNQSKVLVTYHPAYLLRNPNAKKDTWADIKILMDAMGLS